MKLPGLVCGISGSTDVLGLEGTSSVSFGAERKEKDYCCIFQESQSNAILSPQKVHASSAWKKDNNNSMGFWNLKQNGSPKHSGILILCCMIMWVSG